MDQGPLCPCVVTVPLDYNPAREGEPPKPVEDEVILEILSWFDRQFGARSILGYAGVDDAPPGTWEGQPDRTMRVGVAMPEGRTPEFVAIVRAIGTKLKQKAMYYEIGPPSAFIMPIDGDLDLDDPATGGK